MKILNLKTKWMGLVMLLIPMACMHLGNDHPSAPHHSSASSIFYQYSIREWSPGSTLQSAMTGLNTMMAQEGTQTPPEGEKGE